MEQLDAVGLLKAVQTLERNMNVALMYSGLRVPQYRLLDVLAVAGQATVTEMSATLKISRASASVMINDLVRSGIVVVVENHSDRRSFHIQLSEHGMHRLQAARGDLSILIGKLSGRYPIETIRVLNEFARIFSFKPETAKAARPPV